MTTAPARPRAGSARAQLVAEFLRIRRLKLATAAVVAAALLAAAAVVPRLDDLTRDPAFAALDELPLPRWASEQPRDAAAGNRWCVERCRVREREWRSDRDVADTARAYSGALAARHWSRFDTAECPTDTRPGRYRCYRRDAFALDLWVRPAECADAKRRCPGSAVSALVRPFTRAI